MTQALLAPKLPVENTERLTAAGRQERKLLQSGGQTRYCIWSFLGNKERGQVERTD